MRRRKTAASVAAALLVVLHTSELPLQCHGFAAASPGPAPPRMPPLPPKRKEEKQQHRHLSSVLPESSSDDDDTTPLYGPKPRRSHPTAYDDRPEFKGPLLLPSSSSPTRIQNYYMDNELQLPQYPSGTPPQLRKSSSTKLILKTIVDHLAYKDAPIDAKEVAESVEFYLRTSKRLLGAAKTSQKKQWHRQKSDDGKDKIDNEEFVKDNKSDIVVHDLCSGHGLTGMLFAACNPNLKVKIKLVDWYEPASHLQLKDGIAEVCPWIIANEHDNGEDDAVVQFVPARLETYFEMQQKESGDSNGTEMNTNIVISTHACGSLTDDVLRYATATESNAAASIAVMPCCYTGTDKGTPYSIRRALGVSMAADIKRSYFLQDQNYHVDFCTIPREITPMNRIIVAEKRS